MDSPLYFLQEEGSAGVAGILVNVYGLLAKHGQPYNEIHYRVVTRYIFSSVTLFFVPKPLISLIQKA